MAGYLFLLSEVDSLIRCIEQGYYATIFNLRADNRVWLKPYEATFGDYSTMHEGDNVYFFIHRKIYGIGILTNITDDCKYINFPDAGNPHVPDYEMVRPQLMLNQGPISVGQRCICTFKPDPAFFRIGVDMDDVLTSNPLAFRMLRVIQQVSFIKFDDEENQAFKDILLKRNQDSLENMQPNLVFPDNSIHNRLREKAVLNDYKIQHGISEILEQAADGETVRHEMAIEAGLLYQLSERDSDTCSVFGEWDYLSHQVVASPFKPIAYMDRMDIFGYSYIPNHKPTISRYLIIEIKKDPAAVENVDQIMKYVDWVTDEYAHGDYSMISAYLVASDFNRNVIEQKNRVGNRKYIIGVRPAQSLEWSNLRLIKYTYNSDLRNLRFQEMQDAILF
jgi:hypothetical protein